MLYIFFVGLFGENKTLQHHKKHYYASYLVLPRLLNFCRFKNNDFHVDWREGGGDAWIEGGRKEWMVTRGRSGRITGWVGEGKEGVRTYW